MKKAEKEKLDAAGYAATRSLIEFVVRELYIGHNTDEVESRRICMMLLDEDELGGDDDDEDERSWADEDEFDEDGEDDGDEFSDDFVGGDED